MASEVNDAEINYKIARLAGALQHDFDENKQCKNCYMFEREDPHNECPILTPANYVEDLNAMHVAETTLNLSLVAAYNGELAKTTGVLNAIFNKAGPEGWVFHANARQRAEAFLRVHNEWHTQASTLPTPEAQRPGP
jgi:hypothetical protein